MPDIVPCLWFDKEAKEAADFYTSIFPNSKIITVRHYPPGSPRPDGMIMTVEFELDGKKYVALNGGPEFKFNEAMSLQIMCSSQAEVDEYWDKLGQGGEHKVCGWLKDKFGVPWQVSPLILDEMLVDPDPRRAERVMKAMLKMKKIDIAELHKAADEQA